MVEAQVGGGWRFLHPDGRRFEIIRCTRPPEHHWEDLGLTHAELGIHIDSDTAATRWRGERMDYELGVWVLCQQANRTQRSGDALPDDVAAETPSAHDLEVCEDAAISPAA